VSEAPELVSRAWLRHGPWGMFGWAEPGLLVGRAGRISFISEEGPRFETDRSAARASWPWWEFGAGVHLTVDSRIYRISLVRPPNADDVQVSEGGPITRAGFDPTGISTIGEGLESGGSWKEYLA